VLLNFGSRLFSACIWVDPQLQPMNYPVTGATQLATYANTRIEFEGDETKYEVSCVKDVTELPYSTASATRIELGDDASAQANFPYGSTFPFYGADYSSVCVSAPPVIRPLPGVRETFKKLSTIRAEFPSAFLWVESLDARMQSELAQY